MLDTTEFYFREELLAHAKEPRNFGVLKKAVIRKKETNPLCGDEIEMFADVKKGKLSKVMFKGHGCYISQAAASKLTDEVKKKKLGDIINMNEEDVKTMLGATITPARQKCAMLSLRALQEGINDYLITKDKRNAQQ